MTETQILRYKSKEEINNAFHRLKGQAKNLKTSSIQDRKQKLKNFQREILKNEVLIKEALFNDFKKPEAEVGMSEIWPVISEIKHARRNLHKWAKSKSISAPLSMMGTTSKIAYEPKGVVLIIAPWNFPFNLALGPLVSAVAAGNTVVIKPSEISQNTSAVMEKIIKETFSPEDVVMVQGSVEETQHLLSLPFDHIFFTGSPAVGKIVMEAAAKNLSPITLELGGKSPTIVDESANLKDAAKKIVWGKFMNAGQTCVAPDYILVHKKVYDELIVHLKNYVIEYYGQNPEDSDSYPRIINDKQFHYLQSLYTDALEKGALNILDDKFSASEKFISPIILSNINFDMEIMHKEIFGPILPVLTYENDEEVYSIIDKNPNPLAAYVFSQTPKQWKEMAHKIAAGGICINECVIYYGHMNLPFGGHKTSGMGRSHGYFGFLEFSVQKPVLKQRVGLTNLQMLYPPYTRKTNKIIEFLTKYL